MLERPLQSQTRGILISVFALVLLLLIVAGLQSKIPTDILMREPQAVSGHQWYVGFFSNLGAVIWSLTAGISLFTAHVLARHSSQLDICRLLVGGGLLTLLLMADNLFLLHDQVFSGYLGLGKIPIFGAYGFLACSFLVTSRAAIFRSAWPLLIAALGCFGLSIVFDLFFNELGVAIGRGQLLEDGLKLLGIVIWFSYFTLVSYDALRPSKTT